MEATLRVHDRTTANLKKDQLVFTIAFPSERITLRELIRARVLYEVEEYNRKQPEYFQGLVQPTDAEMTLNGYRLPQRRFIDPEAQCQRALTAFERNGFVLLVDERQVEGLDTVIDIGPMTGVTFLKLIPLVGG